MILNRISWMIIMNMIRFIVDPMKKIAFLRQHTVNRCHYISLTRLTICLYYFSIFICLSFRDHRFSSRSISFSEITSFRMRNQLKAVNYFLDFFWILLHGCFENEINKLKFKRWNNSKKDFWNLYFKIIDN